MKTSLSTIELFGDDFTFSIAHFTLFSATSRERLHGHNYHAHVTIVAEMTELGITFDYEVFKAKILAVCKQLDLYLLLPQYSPVLKIVDQEPYYYVYFDQDEMHFLKKDVKLMPIRNITIEELSEWFLKALLGDHQECIKTFRIQGLTVKISNGAGRYAAASWYSV
ncbi:MAG: 6-carboxytetrahydropterin synthase [Gammaproteobacteria bacterium]